MGERYRRGGRRDQRDYTDHREPRGFGEERGPGYGAIKRGDYRGEEPMRAFGDRDRGIGESDRHGREGWQRGRMGGGGFGSEFGSWGSGAGAGFAGAGFGFGRDEDPGRGPEMYGGGGSYGHGDMNSDQPGRSADDSDWAPNRPARGRGIWSGDWADESGGRIGGNRWSSREDYRGRGPRDYRRSDDRIREEVCDRLTDDRSVDASDVSIRVEAGEVTLTGNVPSRDQKRRAEECIERISGVREVINQLRVARTDMTTSPQMSSPATGRSQRASSSTPQSGVAADRSGER